MLTNKVCLRACDKTITCTLNDICCDHINDTRYPKAVTAIDDSFAGSLWRAALE
jgi:hypothetical protein